VGNGTTVDTQLFLFDSSGRGVTSNDDEAAGTTFQSTLSHQFVTGPGLYYLAITQYDRDPIDSVQNLLWQDVYRVEHAPAGPGAATPIAGWGSPSGSGGAYLINLTGVCRVAPFNCGPDLNSDGSIDGDDIAVLVTCLLAPGAGANCTCADLDGNGSI